NKTDLPETVTVPRPDQYRNVQNLLNQLTNPSNVLDNGSILGWLPMFTGSHFGTFPAGIPSNIQLPLQERTVTDYQPEGPLANMFQDQTFLLDRLAGRTAFNRCSKDVSDNFLNILNTAPNQEMTYSDLIKYYDKEQPQVPHHLTTETSVSRALASYATNKSAMNNENITLILYDPTFEIKDLTDEIINNYRQIN
ncbi:unnamed protein product, partial [Didymodactylos carnosus]